MNGGAQEEQKEAVDTEGLYKLLGKIFSRVRPTKECHNRGD